MQTPLFNPNASGDLQRINGAECNNDWADVMRFFTYFGQEFIEATMAINNRDSIAFRDAIADMRVLLDALSAVTDIPMVDDYQEVINKLWSRFDKTEEDAALTLKKYTDLGVSAETFYHEETGYYVTRVKETSTGDNGEYYPAGKFLKSHKFQEPVLKLLPREMIDSKPGVEIEEYRNLDVTLKLEIK